MTGEVDWVGLIGFSGLMVKAPGVVESIRKNPEVLVEDALSQTAVLARIAADKLDVPARFSYLFPSKTEEENLEPDDASRRLLAFLFPLLSEDPRSNGFVENQICSRRPLLTILRMGLVPGVASRNEIEEFLEAENTVRLQILDRHIASGTIGPFIDRFEEVYTHSYSVNNERLWKDLSIFFEKQESWLLDFDIRVNLLTQVRSTFMRTARNEGFNDYTASDLTETLLKADDKNISPYIIRRNYFSAGLFGTDSSGRGATQFFEIAYLEQLVKNLGAAYRSQLIEGSLIKTCWLPDTIFILLDSGAWDKSCTAALANQLEDNNALQTLMILFFRENNIVEKNSLSKMLDVDYLLQRVEHVLGDENLEIQDYSLRALKRAQRELTGRQFDPE